MKKYWIALPVALAIVATVAYYRTTPDQNVTSDVAVINQLSANDQPSQPPVQSAPVRNPNQGNAGFPFKDTSPLKPPAGAKVALYEFEDMECPGCAAAFPVVHAAAAHYKVPLVRHDYPWSFHLWSFDAAVTARYIQDKLSPQLADDFRRDIFASQTRIASKDDLIGFTARWFQSHGQTLPFVMDPSGACKLEVESDRALGDRVGVHSTPCIFVVTQSKAVPVFDLNQLDHLIDAALTETASLDSPSPSEIRRAAIRVDPVGA
jgi:protein-disulfide isomerase